MLIQLDWSLFGGYNLEIHQAKKEEKKLIILGRIVLETNFKCLQFIRLLLDSSYLVMICRYCEYEHNIDEFKL